MHVNCTTPAIDIQFAALSRDLRETSIHERLPYIFTPARELHFLIRNLFLFAVRKPLACFFLQSGMTCRSGDSKPFVLKGTSLLDAINLCKRINRDESLFPAGIWDSSDDASELFLQEKVPMMLTTYSSLNQLKGSRSTYDISPVPYLNQPITKKVIVGVAVNKKTKSKEAARLLVDYLSSTRPAADSRAHADAARFKYRRGWEPSANAGFFRPRRYDLFRKIIPSYRTSSDMGIPPPAPTR